MQARADSEFAAEAGADMADGEEDGQENKPTGPAWEGTDRDYSYEELLGEYQRLHHFLCYHMYSLPPKHLCLSTTALITLQCTRHSRPP